ncbi:hypothetical protein C8R44DRAFT_865563 [Mycena epipterygia]|nr:hypothetical protein C8R44DRAFT_865563 [Mycena epipterygia]
MHASPPVVDPALAVYPHAHASPVARPFRLTAHPIAPRSAPTALYSARPAVAVSLHTARPALSFAPPILPVTLFAQVLSCYPSTSSLCKYLSDSSPTLRFRMAQRTCALNRVDDSYRKPEHLTLTLTPTIDLPSADPFIPVRTVAFCDLTSNNADIFFFFLDVLLNLKRPSAPYTGVDPLAHAYPAMHMAQRRDRGYCCVVYYHLVPFHEHSLIFTHSFPSFSSPRACIDHPPKQDEQAALAPLTIWPMYTMRGISPHRTTPSLHLLPAHDIALLLSSRSFPHPPSPHKSRLSHAILDARTAFLDAYSSRPTHPFPSPP